jgi:hypothetical protein
MSTPFVWIKEPCGDNFYPLEVPTEHCLAQFKVGYMIGLGYLLTVPNPTDLYTLSAVGVH